MIAALAIIVIGMFPSSPQASSPWDRLELFASGPTIAAIDADADLPSKEYGLFRPASEDEGEEEDGDGDDAKSLGAGLASFPLTFARSSRFASAVRRAKRAIAVEPRVSFLRC